MTDISEYLKTVWCEHLGLRDVGADDDFFALGGDSMIVIRMLVAVSAKLDVELDYDRFFAAPNIATLAQLIEEATARR